MINDYLVTDVYKSGNYVKINSLMFDYDKLSIESNDEYVNIELNNCFELQADEYQVVVKKKADTVTIIIKHKNQRGLRYGIKAIEEMYKNNELPIVKIIDKPSFALRGIIEGFYGAPWGTDNRIDCIKFLSENKMNTFMYAPKDDLYHRDKWRELYPTSEFENLKKLKELSDKELIDFYYCISPGNNFSFSENDFELLYAKLDQVLAIGVSKYCLLLDDIDYTLNGENSKRYKSPGIAHAFICNKLNMFLKTKTSDATLIMCPTEYFQNWNTQYRNELKKYLDSDIKVFWTGYNTIAEVISNEESEKVREYFGHELVLWDNYPVNDVTKDRIFLGPLVNRGSRLAESHFGMVSNPMIQWNLSKISVITMAHYMWNCEKYIPEVSYEYALKQMTKDQPELLDSLRFIADNNRSSILCQYNISEVDECIINKDIKAIENYYDEFNRHFEMLMDDYKDNRFLEELKPWYERFKVDYEVVKAIGKNEDVSHLSDKALSMENTIGSNIALRYAKHWKYTDKDIVKRYRINFWEESQ